MQGDEPEFELDERDCIGCDPAAAVVSDDGEDGEQCDYSESPCGHHCNHLYTHDECCWCGATVVSDE